MTVKLKDFLYSPTAGLRNHIEGKLLEDAVIAMLISLAKIAPRHRFTDAEMVKLSAWASIATIRSRRLSRFESCPIINVSS